MPVNPSTPAGGLSSGTSVFRASPANNASTTTTPRAKPSVPPPPTSNSNNISNASAAMPLSARKSQALDLSTVERRGQSTNAREIPRGNRLFGLQEAPTFRPTEDEFRDPMEYIRKVAPEGEKYGIMKIIPPDGWNPPFAVDTERFHFRTRRQELNNMEGGTRSNLNYLDQLQKFHKQHGASLTRFPSVDKRPLDLYKLKKAVETRGGFEKVCKQKKWAEIGRDLGYSGKIMSSLSTSLKNSYQKWLQPYEEYLRAAKPGVRQMLEAENGGPFTPSPARSPTKKSLSQASPVTGGDSPAVRASNALNNSLQDSPAPVAEPSRPITSSGFTAVNTGGFTAVNAQPAATAVRPAMSAFSAINAPNGITREADGNHSTPLRQGESPLSSAANTPDMRPSSFTPIRNGALFTTMKRQHSQDSESPVNGDSDATGRRSKRLKRDPGSAPTVTGSHMTQPRLGTPRFSMPRDRPDEKPGDKCESCGKADDPTAILLCDSCDAGYHRYCLEPPLKTVPDHDWHCPKCLVGTGEYGFEEGGVYSLRQFQEKANAFKENHFGGKNLPFDPVKDSKRAVSEDDVEREFWKLVQSLTEAVEVEYGADIHSTTHGSGFPTIERNPRDPYSIDPWNLNVLPLTPESLFRFIKSEITGMTVPWLYVGMCFSTFCWHAEDHYAYSANYQHFGSTKTWYGVPGEDAEKFEAAMRAAVPDLFETQPDLLFQLVTLLTPEQLQKAGVRVYALDQRAGQMVITFPQAYHAGFNHGFNFNEAVNFAPSDWEPFGDAGVQRLQEFRRPPVFSHDELLLTAAAQKDITIKTAKWLAPALERLLEREMALRESFVSRSDEMRKVKTEAGGSNDGQIQISYEAEDEEGPEEGYACTHCKSFTYLSRFVCNKSSKVFCLLHPGNEGTFDCCDTPEVDRILGTHDAHHLVFKFTDAALQITVQKVVEKAKTPDVWIEKLDKLLDDDPRPSLKSVRSLLTEGEKIAWDLPQLPDLKRFVERCDEWVVEATNYISRKQPNRRKNERAWRRGTTTKIPDIDDRDRELRKVENITKLLATANDISFDCPEITTLQELSDKITKFQKDAQAAVAQYSFRTTKEMEELVEVGRSFNLDIPEIERLDKIAQQLKWYDQARERRNQPQTLQEISDFIQQGYEVGVPEGEPHILHFLEQKQKGELWETKAKELMSVENVHYQQLDALSLQASSLPVSPTTLAAVDAILKKQRDAQEQIQSLYERSKNPDYRLRPKYMEVREAMSALTELNSKPTGTIDLEKEQKRHEDWMRRGKKLFGKANAPLHILHSHMQWVETKNRYCFDIADQPRMPVEPASRANTPDDDADNVDGSGSSRDVFCICRKPEAGMMIECELCHEWYHGRCLKIARGKVKDDDKYTCPICDYRVKIPRDAARPKLEDLQGWQDEILTLPFQPEEEETLESMISVGSEFRHWIAKYINPLMSNPDELTTQRFYLRKLEGAEILLADEINFFRQELHKWAPVAPEPPPLIEVSLSTRKPRPTKQQKLMTQLGITNPEDLPQHLRPKSQTTKKKKDEVVKKKDSQNPMQEQSHTPPGLPQSLSLGGDHTTDYFATAPVSDYSHSPIFRPVEPFGQSASGLSPSFNSASTNPPIDPAMFTASSFGRPGSPAHTAFGSSQTGGGNMDSMFADLTNVDEPLGTSHTDEALAVTAAVNGHEEPIDKFLND